MSGSNWKWVVAGALALAGVLAFFLLAIRSASSPPAIEVKLPEAPAGDGVLKVYVTGAVARPGVYELQSGDRHAEALTAAGGPTEDAEPLGVNMAQRARDEDHIHVPRKGEAAPQVGSEPVLDLNTATVGQLETLPGIGPARAQQIVESRTKDGAFTTPDDLVLRKIIPQSMFESIRERVQVRP